MLWEPIFEPQAGGDGLVPLRVRRLLAASLLLSAGFAVGMAWWPAAALLLTALLVWSVVVTVARLVAVPAAASADGC